MKCCYVNLIIYSRGQWERMHNNSTGWNTNTHNLLVNIDENTWFWQRFLFWRNNCYYWTSAVIDTLLNFVEPCWTIVGLKEVLVHKQKDLWHSLNVLFLVHLDKNVHLSKMLLHVVFVISRISPNTCKHSLKNHGVLDRDESLLKYGDF